MPSSGWVQRWSTKEAFVSASKVTVTGDWSDSGPTSLNYTETGLGPRFALNFGTAENQVQFYFITPSHDWRGNQTYRYKLTTSWISTASSKPYDSNAAPTNNNDDPKQGPGYYFWNLNNYINSEMLIPHGYDAFTCDYFELSYWNGGRKQVLAEGDAKIVLQDFSIGFLQGQDSVYDPCKSKGKCRAIDGKVTCGDFQYWQYGVLSIVALALLFYCIIRQLFSFKGTDDYRQIIPNDDEEEYLEDEVNSSLKRSAVIELANAANGNGSHEDFNYDDDVSSFLEEDSFDDEYVNE